MSTLMLILLTNTFLALVLTGLAIAGGLLRRVAFAHAIWMLVLVKLITPPLLQLPILPMMGSQIPAVAPHQVREMTASGVIQSQMELEKPAAAKSGISATPSIRATAPKKVAGLQAQKPVRIAAESSSKPAVETTKVAHFNIAALLLGAWIVGSLGILWTILHRLRQFRRLLRMAKPAPTGLQSDIRELANRLNLRAPHTLMLPTDTSPMIFFFGFRPLLLLPERITAALSAAQRKAVIAHELAHLARRDHYARLLEMLATLLLWWHPMVWLARRGLRNSEELACDQLVLAQLPGQQHAYASALVETLQHVYARSPACSSGLGELASIQRRLHMILHQTPTPAFTRATRMALTLAVLILPLAPTLAQTGSTGAAVIPASSAAAPATSDPTAKAINALLESASDPEMRAAAFTSIGRMGSKAIPTLVAALKNPKLAAKASEFLHSNAAWFFQNMGSDSVSSLLDTLGSPDPQARVLCLQALEIISQKVLLQEALNTIQRTPRARGTGRSFGGGGGGIPESTYVPGRLLFSPVPDSPAPLFLEKVSPAVTKALTDVDTNVRAEAVHLWGNIARVSAGDESLMPLITALKDKEAKVRTVAAAALGKIGPESAAAVPALILALGDSSAGVRRAAITAIYWIGPAAVAATPALTQALKDSNPAFRAAAAATLGSVNASTPLLGANASAPFSDNISLDSIMDGALSTEPAAQQPGGAATVDSDPPLPPGDADAIENRLREQRAAMQRDLTTRPVEPQGDFPTPPGPGSIRY